jgi:TolB-like protein
MSPEQVTGRPADARSDLFAFGVVLYEMLSGRRAFERSSAFETLSATLKEEPPELEAPAGTIPLPLKRLVAHCLEKEPGRRFQSAQDLVYDLEAALAAPSSVAATSGAQVPVLGRRPRPLVLVVATLVLGAAVGLFFWKPWMRALPAGHIPSVVALPAKVFGGQESFFLADAIPDTLSTLLATVEGLDTKVPPSQAQVEKVQGDVARVAEAYRAEFLVLTTVTAEGDRLHLNVKLAEGATQKVRWASQYEGTRATYAALLRAAADGLTRALKPSGSAAVGAPAFRSDVELALREGKYFQGHYYQTRQAQDFNQALAAFQKAQSLDPASALLAAEIANLFQDMYFVMRDAKAGAESERWAIRALELDPRCGWAWVARTHIETNRPRVNQSTVVASALKAARYAPTDARAYTTLGAIAPTAAFQAATGIRAMELDPLNTFGYAWAAMCLTITGRAEEALLILDRAIRVQPRPGFHTWLKYFALFHAGRFEEAKQAYTEASWEEVSRLMRSLLAGDTAAGRELARGYLADWRKAELGSMDWVNRVTFYGPLLVRLGLNEEALWVLDKSVATGFPPSYDFLLLDPDLRKLQGDPRYLKALAASRNYALLFLKQADEAKVRGEFPIQMEPALAELRVLVNRNL